MTICVGGDTILPWDPHCEAIVGLPASSQVVSSSLIRARDEEASGGSLGW